MIKNKTVNYLFLSAFVILSTACSSDSSDPVIPNQEELITSVTYSLYELDSVGQRVDATPSFEFSFRDIDGDGGEAPVITDGFVLPLGKTYEGVLYLANESVSPAENVTAEVEEEGTEHQFFFTPSNQAVGVEYSDEDLNGLPIGIETTLNTLVAGAESVTIQLRHEPAKTAEGVSTGDITNAGGSTDVQVTFDLTVDAN